MSLGELEQVVLFAVVRLGGETHGAPVVEEIEERTGRRVSPGALYTVLGRLESKGFVESWIGDTVPDRGGRRRRVYIGSSPRERMLYVSGTAGFRTWRRAS